MTWSHRASSTSPASSVTSEGPGIQPVGPEPGLEAWGNAAANEQVPKVGQGGSYVDSGSAPAGPDAGRSEIERQPGMDRVLQLKLLVAPDRQADASEVWAVASALTVFEITRVDEWTWERLARIVTFAQFQDLVTRDAGAREAVALADDPSVMAAVDEMRAIFEPGISQLVAEQLEACVADPDTTRRDIVIPISLESGFFAPLGQDTRDALRGGHGIYEVFLDGYVSEIFVFVKEIDRGAVWTTVDYEADTAFRLELKCGEHSTVLRQHCALSGPAQYVTGVGLPTSPEVQWRPLEFAGAPRP